MKKNNFYFFKRAFLMSVPIAVFIIVRDLFGIELSDTSEIMKTVVKTVVKGISVGVITGIILGIINIFAKVETLVKNK